MGLNELLTVKEAAEWLKTSRVQVRKMIQSGELLAVKVGREYRIPHSECQGVYGVRARIKSCRSEKSRWMWAFSTSTCSFYG